jgi:hypothetical protein
MRKDAENRGRRAFALAGRAVRRWIWRLGASVSARNAQVAGGEPHRTVLDKLIDGESVTVTGIKGEEFGYLIGYTSRKLPALIRELLLTKDVPRVELEAWRDLIQDLSRDMPEEVTMIFWEDLPLAVWCPAGHRKEFSFNPN